MAGVDITKHRHEVMIAAPGKTGRRRLSVTNSAGDLMRLTAIRREYDLPVRSDFEATGTGHRALIYHPGVAVFDPKRKSSVSLAGICEALHDS
ncbi:hypothetical protein [Paracoccus sp. IB05]|uniref:hypothetical protein n=1 Tax=Paracoccus sp. IB05 TaxID=2779367 RepID=UPI0018E8D0CF|nr:hypothetical protein [Paracoccus sp. IB05]MBJ2150056.1 hypothetical protein [Paracoccus sp. IB05]